MARWKQAQKEGNEMFTTEQKPMSAAASVGEATNSSIERCWAPLNTGQRSEEAREFERELFTRIVAQDNAVLALSQIYQVYLAKMTLPNKPLGTLLFLGPTGSGKTRSVEAAAEILFGDADAMVKVDCAEFQHSHEISKLVGSPPGYLGHRETKAALTQETLDRHHTSRNRLTFVLFDEIEKASDALWHLLLGVLDKGRVTLGDNRRVDFSNCVIVMTSNLGAREMAERSEGRHGFGWRREAGPELNEKLEKIGVEAARHKFSPEFINRLDKIVVFNSLTQEAMRRILDIELQGLQRRVLLSGSVKFAISFGERSKEVLLAEGFDRRYGTRPLKRAIERRLMIPLSNLMTTGQIKTGDTVRVDADEKGGLRFEKRVPSSTTGPEEGSATSSAMISTSCAQ
jgi:ATP-dependent Clp protease ATP-binding subunit ClpA